MARMLWVREIRRNRIMRDAVVPCEDGDWQQALVEACRSLDLGLPLILPKALADMDSFAQTRFQPSHFMEAVAFERLEVELFDPEVKKKSGDIRNAGS